MKFMKKKKIQREIHYRLNSLWPKMMYLYSHVGIEIIRTKLKLEDKKMLAISIHCFLVNN